MSTPLDIGSVIDDVSYYKGLIGRLLYLTTIRLDITFSDSIPHFQFVRCRDFYSSQLCASLVLLKEY